MHAHPLITIERSSYPPAAISLSHDCVRSVHVHGLWALRPPVSSVFLVGLVKLHVYSCLLYVCLVGDKLTCWLVAIATDYRK